MRPNTLGATLAQDDDAVDEAPKLDLPPILIVDDDAGIRKSLATLFKDRYKVLLCVSAKEGVDAVHEDICVVILDVRMKGHDGFWACEKIRQKHPDMPVIFYSAYQDLKDPYRVINEHRPFGYITKHGDAGELIEAVDMAVRLRKMVLYNQRLVEQVKQERGRRA